MLLLDKKAEIDMCVCVKYLAQTKLQTLKQKLSVYQSP